MNGRHGFGPRLRAQRERRGITLTSIAESTKIKRSLLEALERGDVSQWPRGLYRRAYMRDYACAIGLAPAPLVEEFGRLFPEDGVSEESGLAAEPLRMTLAGEPKVALRAAARAHRAAIEMGLVLVAAGVAAFATGIAYVTACAAVALVYYPLAATITGRTPDPRRLRALLARRRPSADVAPVEAREEPARIYVVAEQRTSGLPFVHAVAGEEFPQHHGASH